MKKSKEKDRTYLERIERVDSRVLRGKRREMMAGTSSVWARVGNCLTWQVARLIRITATLQRISLLA